MNQEEIYKKLRKIRIEKGFSQKYIGEQCGLTQQAINRIEQGKRKIDIELLLKISAALDIDPFNDILTNNILFHSVLDLEDEPLTNYIKSLGYTLTLIDEQYYLLSKGCQTFKITHDVRSKLFTEIDDYTIYKLENIIKSQII